MASETTGKVAKKIMIDWHCHLLPGIDDGAKTIEESLEMARLLHASGYTEVCCTPHRITGGYDNTTEIVRSATAALQEELTRKGIPLALHPGTEYYLDEFLPGILKDPLPLPGNLLLVELPLQCDFQMVQRILAKVTKEGLVPLIAHPERCRLLDPQVEMLGFSERLRKIFSKNSQTTITIQQSPLMLYLLDIGCKFQGNLGSLMGYYGERVRNNTIHLQASGYYSHWGSDAHNVNQLMAVFKN